MGYKGFPALAEHRPFNVVKGVVIDCLHCVLLGMSTMLLNTWLNTSNAQKPFYLGREVSSLYGVPAWVGLLTVYQLVCIL